MIRTVLHLAIRMDSQITVLYITHFILDNITRKSLLYYTSTRQSGWRKTAAPSLALLCVSRMGQQPAALSHVQIVQDDSTLRRPWVETVGAERTIREARVDLVMTM